ncbi:hypothetical protein PIB30_074547 [Stylosanthes scabra]|uniref:Uncharacterized protein n=1 Tax=Stylosanthes scabra TaxID=79078 RepID=A0ABU6RQ02_9FABA|nr:hypothetical protein [Stylosanthes scabra]
MQNHLPTPPLHTALAGHLEFCMKIMRLKSLFGMKLNRKGFSPIHVALHNNEYNLVRRLVEINKELIQVKGRKGVTPLHFDVDLLIGRVKINAKNLENQTVLSPPDGLTQSQPQGGTDNNNLVNVTSSLNSVGFLGSHPMWKRPNVSNKAHGDVEVLMG